MENCRNIGFENIRNTTGCLVIENGFMVYDNLSGWQSHGIPFMAADCHTRLKGLSIIGICTDGRLRLCIGPKSMEISAGQAFMLFAGEKFRLADASPDLKIRLVIFKDEFMRWKGDILRSAGLHETPPCEAHLFTLAGSVLQECVATYESIRSRLSTWQPSPLLLPGFR